MVDQRPQTQLLHRQDLFFCSSRSLTRVRTGMEHCGSRSEREHPNKARVSRCSFPQELIEAPALQQGFPFVSINSAVLNEILGNKCLLHGQWIRHESNCTNLAVFSLKSPEVFRSGSVGRPRYLISEKIFLHLRSSRFTDSNRSNASCFTVDIETSYCGVWTRGDGRLLHDFGWDTRQSRRTFHE